MENNSNNYEYIKSSLDCRLDDYYQMVLERAQLMSYSCIAGMDQVVISTPDKPIIGTQALDTCFGILLYDRKNKFGICGHANPKNIFGIVVEMLKQIPSTANGNIEYQIVSGYRAIEENNFKGIDEIRNILRNYEAINPKIKFTSLKSSLTPKMPNGLLCYDFAFDTSTGKDVTNIVFIDFTEEQNKRHI